jgi:branched-subunit amino acid aminotransferase/4-amino-4-deoxychorismate lyase
VEFGQFYLYKNGTLAPISEPADQEVGLAVADSFLVEDGAMRGRKLHEQRFAAGVAAMAPEYLSELPSFFEQAFALVPRSGRWWPRFEVHLGSSAPNQLYLRLRPAPEPLGKAILWTLPEPDPRVNQNIKGPDLSLGQQLRRKAKMHGADEAVLLNAEGKISEGALSSLLWWRGDVLCAPSDSIAWLPSVTRSLVIEIARQCETEVRFEEALPENLIGCEVWLLSALNGIRPVSEWVNLGGEVGEPAHLEAFSKRLRLFTEQLD